MRRKQMLAALFVTIPDGSWQKMAKKDAICSQTQLFSLSLRLRASFKFLLDNLNLISYEHNNPEIHH